jgi:uncharacterized membrane protein YebE (DUF533 family)
MSLNAVVGQLLREGMSPASRTRLEHSTGPSGLGALDTSGGLGNMLNSMLGEQAAGRSPGEGGGILGGIGKVLSGSSGIGGLSRGEVGGIGAIAGALLGGRSIKGAIGGGAMALLGTLAISALKNWQTTQAARGGSTSAPDTAPAAAPNLTEAEVRQMTAPETAELCLRGMIEAAKSDGEITPEEIERITGKLQEGGISAEEQRFVMEQMAKPADVQGLIAAIPNREVAAQVYAAALMAISADTDAERAFLAEVARGTGLGAGPVQNLHRMVGAPTMVA